MTTELNTLTTAKLVEIYNLLSEKPTARFSSREVALRRVGAELAKEGSAQRLLRRGMCPGCYDAGNGLTQGHLGRNGEETHMHLLMCHVCCTEWNENTGRPAKEPKASTTRSAGIAASWQDADVRAARSTHTAVTVPGKGQFRSVPAAFRALSLPMNQMIRVRLEVKRTGTAEIAGFVLNAATNGKA